MKMSEIIDQLALEVKAGAQNLDVHIAGGYVSDMLSDVIANCQKGDLWITLQIHQNIVAVASLKEMAGIVIIGSKEPAADTIAKAEEEGMPLLSSQYTAFELAGRLYTLGIRSQS